LRVLVRALPAHFLSDALGRELAHFVEAAVGANVVQPARNAAASAIAAAGACARVNAHASAPSQGRRCGARRLAAGGRDGLRRRLRVVLRPGPSCPMSAEAPTSSLTSRQAPFLVANRR
jgi:hypothetical protein